MTTLKPLGRLATICAFACVAASCSSIDTTYYKLLPLAESNPDPEALVGMWHRKSTDYAGGTFRRSFLFNRDRTGLIAYYASDFFLGTSEQNYPFTWTYQGSGVWKARFDAGGSFELRLSQGKILRTAFLEYNVLQKVAE